MSNSGPSSEAESMAVQARIAWTLAALADPRHATALQIPAYTRRHLAEHAAAGASLSERTVPTALLPYLDVTRLRDVASYSELPYMPLVRKAAYAWSWESPGQNAAALRFLAAAEQFTAPDADLQTPWTVAWAKSPGASEILARIDSVTCVDATSLDDRIVVATGSRNGGVDLWDLASGQSIQLPTHRAGVNVVTLSVLADGDLLLATGGDGGVVRCWLVQRTAGQPATWHDAQLIRSFDVGDAVTALSSVRLSGRWHVLVGQADGQVSVLDWAGGGRQGRQIHDGDVSGVAAVPLADEVPAIVSAGVDATLQVSSFGDRLAAVGPRLRADEAIRAVISLRHSDGRAMAVTAGDRGSLQVWDLPPGPHRCRSVPCGTADVTTLTAGFEPQYGTVVVSGDSQGRLRIIDADVASAAEETIEAHRRGITGLAFARSRHGRPIVISGGGDGTVRRWDLGTAMAEGPRSAGPAARAGDDPSSAARFPVSSVRVWRLDDGRELGQDMSADTHRMMAAATVQLADGTMVAVTDGGQSPAAHNVRATAISAANLPDGRVVAVSASTDGYLRLWDLTTADDAGGFLPWGRPLPHPGVRSVATVVRSDGRAAVVSAGRDRNLRIWDLSSDEPASDELTGHSRPVTALAIAAASGRPAVIVSGSEDTTLRMWQADTGFPIGPAIRGHRRHITALAAAYLDDGVMAVTGCAGDGAVRAWNLLDDDPRPQLLTQHEGPVTAVAMSAAPAGAVVVSAGEDRTLQVWDLASAAPLLDPMPVPGTVRAIACFSGTRPGAVIAGDDVLAVVHW